MKPPKIERHSFQCMYCNKKRWGDRPWHYRHYGWNWFYHIECRENWLAVNKVLRNLGR